MKTTRVVLVSVAALAGSAASATAQITPIGPFTGSVQEGFQTIGQWPPNGPCIFCPTIPGAFGGRCTLESPTGASTMHVTGGWSFVCQINAHSTPRLSASTGGGYDYHFNPGEGPTKFGGYFGTNSGTAGGTIEFFDASGVSIGTAPLNFEADCSWRWNGWEFSVPVERIRVVGNYSGGGYVMMDDMEYDRGSTPPPCYANCDGSTSVPILNVNDFICFQTNYAAGASSANCDGSTAVPILNVNDFICFQSAYAAGCP